MSKKAMLFTSLGIGIGYYAFKNRNKLKRIMNDVKDMMQEEKYMLEDMI